MPRPARPGTYDYAQTGTSSIGEVPPAGTLVADPAGADGRQVQHRYIDPRLKPGDSSMLFSATGPFITDVTAAQQGADYTCHFDPPIAAPPWPPTDGATLQGHAACDGITVDVSGTVTEHRSVALDGNNVAVVVIHMTVATSGQVDSTTDDTEWWAPSLGVPTHSETHFRGSVSGITTHADITSDLKSASPR